MTCGPSEEKYSVNWVPECVQIVVHNVVYRIWKYFWKTNLHTHNGIMNNDFVFGAFQHTVTTKYDPQLEKGNLKKLSEFYIW